MAELTEVDLAHLRRCVELAREALDAGDEPFGSVLVDADGTALAEGRNRVVETGDATQHPEFELARWAAAHLTPEQRAGATVYTSGEHCAMCAAAHGWVGLGRIVYASSSAQLGAVAVGGRRSAAPPVAAAAGAAGRAAAWSCRGRSTSSPTRSVRCSWEAHRRR